MSAIKNEVTITMQNGDKVRKLVDITIPSVQQKYEIGKRINYCTARSSVKNGQIAALTVGSFTCSM